MAAPAAENPPLPWLWGKSWDLPVVHLDQLWWKEGWRNVTREEFDSRLAMAMNMDGWIIDGNYSRTMEMRLAKVRHRYLSGF